MYVEGIQICQINRWNNSSQNMYGMNGQKLTVWPGKSILCKKHSFGGQKSGLPDFGRPWTQKVDTRSTSDLPLKTLGYDGSN